MGAAIRVFPGSLGVAVPHQRIPAGEVDRQTLLSCARRLRSDDDALLVDDRPSRPSILLSRAVCDGAGFPCALPQGCRRCECIADGDGERATFGAGVRCVR